MHGPDAGARRQTCFLRLFIAPMMLDSCLYSFLSLFFLEADGFSGEATPVMSATGGRGQVSPVPTQIDTDAEQLVRPP